MAEFPDFDQERIVRFFFIVKKCRNMNPYTNMVHFIVETGPKLGDCFMYYYYQIPAEFEV